jgi:hypothetical protein
MNSVRDAVTKLGLLKDDLDYHLTGASMVIILLFFRLSEVVRGPGINSLRQQRQSHFLDVSGFWHSGGHLLFRGSRIVVWWALVLELRNKNLGILRALGLYHYRHDYPVYAGWRGCVCRRVPRYDGESCIPNEGSPVPSVAAGRNECGFSGSRQFEGSRTWPT